MKKSLKIKLVKPVRSRETPLEPTKPLESNTGASSKGYNPTVYLKYKGTDVFKTDLWTLAMAYAPREALSRWESLELYLDDKRVEGEEKGGETWKRK